MASDISAAANTHRAAPTATAAAPPVQTMSAVPSAAIRSPLPNFDLASRFLSIRTSATCRLLSAACCVSCSIRAESSYVGVIGSAGPLVSCKIWLVAYSCVTPFVAIKWSSTGTIPVSSPVILDKNSVSPAEIVTFDASAPPSSPFPIVIFSPMIHRSLPDISTFPSFPSFMFTALPSSGLIVMASGVR